MNKYDKMFIGILILLVICLYIPSLVLKFNHATNNKMVVVYYRDEEIMRQKLSEDKTYVVDGALGDVVIEVKDDKVRVEKEDSPYHICSIQGWVEDGSTPIVCLPNEIVVRIIYDEDVEVDTVIQ